VSPVEFRPAEVRPAEVSLVEVRLTEVRPAEVRPAEVRQAEVRQAEVRPAEVNVLVRLFCPPRAFHPIHQLGELFTVGHVGNNSNSDPASSAHKSRNQTDRLVSGMRPRHEGAGRRL
jgi:hypothetical protein